MLKRKIYFIFKRVYEHVSVCEYVHESVGAQGDQKMVQTTQSYG